jgi:flagellar biosynthetic protein FliP
MRLPRILLCILACFAAAAPLHAQELASETAPPVAEAPALPATIVEAPPVAAAPAPVAAEPRITDAQAERALRAAAARLYVPPAAAPAAAPVPATATAPAAPAAAGLPTDTTGVVRIAVVLTLMSLLPGLLICMTSFVRIIVVLSMIRHGFGMPETPPNTVLVSLAIFLTAFSMMPTFTAVNERGLQPFLAGTASVEQAIDQGSQPVRAFMLRQVHDQDLETVYAISKQPLPASASEVGLMQLTTGFMLNELRVAFKIGFVILLPFLLIDLVVSSILLSLGMLMVPPSTLSLPLKVLMFVLIDGWSLVLEGVLGSFR